MAEKDPQSNLARRRLHLASIDLDQVDTWELQGTRVDYFRDSHSVVINFIFERSLRESIIDCSFVATHLDICFAQAQSEPFVIHMTRVHGCTCSLRIGYRRGMTATFKQTVPLSLSSKLTGHTRIIQSYEYQMIKPR